MTKPIKKKRYTPKDEYKKSVRGAKFLLRKGERGKKRKEEQGIRNKIKEGFIVNKIFGEIAQI
jgi:hypothetical protein